MEVRVKSPAILAEGACLAVSAYLDAEKALRVPSEALKAAVMAFTLGDLSHVSRLGWRDAVIAYTLVYGGVLLSYTCDPVVPIARVYVKTGIELEKASGGYSRRLGDNVILKAWAHMVSGEEEVGLKLIEGATTYPETMRWRAPGSLRISPSPLVVTATPRDLELLRLEPSYLDEVVRPWS